LFQSTSLTAEVRRSWAVFRAEALKASDSGDVASSLATSEAMAAMSKKIKIPMFAVFAEIFRLLYR
jgi:hypothetical protein